MVDFVVAESSAVLRAPVDDIFPAVDETLIEQPDKNFFYSIRQSFVHRKTFTLPIAGNAELAELPNDSDAVLFAPLPYTFDEFFSSKIVPVLAFFGERFFNCILRSDACMVGPGNPARFESGHPFPANEYILQRIIQNMSHRQNAGNIRRRNDDCKRDFVLIDLAVEKVIRFPEGIPFIFDVFWRICLRKFLHSVPNSN